MDVRRSAGAAITWGVLWGVALAAPLSGCGGEKPNPQTAASTAASPAAAPQNAPADPPAPAEAAPPKKKHRPYEITNHCADVVTIVFGDEPKTAPKGKRTIGPNDTIEGPRGDDGTETIWLVDDKGEPLLNVHVTRGIKKVQIGRSCRTLDAR